MKKCIELPILQNGNEYLSSVVANGNDFTAILTDRMNVVAKTPSTSISTPTMHYLANSVFRHPPTWHNEDRKTLTQCSSPSWCYGANLFSAFDSNYLFWPMHSRYPSFFMEWHALLFQALSMWDFFIKVLYQVLCHLEEHRGGFSSQQIRIEMKRSTTSSLVSTCLCTK